MFASVADNGSSSRTYTSRESIPCPLGHSLQERNLPHLYPNLKAVDLSSVDVADAGLACLTQLTKVQRLILNRCSSVTNARWHSLQAA